MCERVPQGFTNLERGNRRESHNHITMSNETGGQRSQKGSGEGHRTVKRAGGKTQGSQSKGLSWARRWRKKQRGRGGWRKEKLDKLKLDSVAYCQGRAVAIGHGKARTAGG